MVNRNALAAVLLLTLMARQLAAQEPQAHDEPLSQDEKNAIFSLSIWNLLNGVAMVTEV
jgi:hypothetical protein